eukprot:3999782-Pyramimonas_sp.AAC.1
MRATAELKMPDHSCQCQSRARHLRAPSGRFASSLGCSVSIPRAVNLLNLEATLLMTSGSRT